MISLYESSIADILPEILSHKPEVQALGYALSRGLQRLMDYCQNISIYASIDTLPEEILDLLAVELDAPYYDDFAELSVKRNLIKNALAWYMSAGTVSSVVQSIETVFGNGDIKEWFEYGGEPYYFKIYTSTMNTTDEMIKQIEEIIGKMQNVRSRLEEVVVEAMQRLPLYHACIVESIEESYTIGIDMDV